MLAEAPTHLSPSSAALWRECPASWWYHYIDRLREPPTEAMERGTFVHRVLELLMALPPHERTLDAAKELARKVWDTELDQLPGLAGLTDEQLKATRIEAWRAIRNYFELDDPTTVEVRALEYELRTTVGGVPFLGYVDRLEGVGNGSVVTDYKTGKAPEQGKRWTRQREMEKLEQLLMYGAILRDDGVVPAGAQLIFLSPERPGIVSIRCNDQQLDQALDRMRATWQQIGRALDRGSAPADPGPLCGWCDHVDRCLPGQTAVRERQRAGKNVGPSETAVWL